MPTGYTEFIEDGSVTTGKEFILLCARGFGALVNLRDKPLSPDIPDYIEESDYYKNRLQEETMAYESLKKMTPEEIHMENEAQYQKGLEKHHKMLEKAIEHNKKYDDIYAEVQKWDPPTASHENLKDFALEQIEISKEDTNAIVRWIQAYEKAPDDEWYQDMLKYYEKAIEHSKKMAEEEHNRVVSRTKWIKDLKKSLEEM